ncbi:MAG TPA: hypothetical protein VG870_02575 [Chitinophagaceae bacterium]|nr:hypothetical protein [Chitinophagaceae bacterium]
MKLRALLVLFFLLLSLVPLYQADRWARLRLQPRRSPARLLLYLLAMLVLVFAYTALLVWVVGRVLPRQ